MMSFLRARSGTEDFDMLIDTKLRVCSNMRTSQELPTSRKQLISDPLASQVSDDDDDDAIVPRAIAAPDKVSPEELDAFLTNELTRLSMEERDQIAQELHCITETIDEEPAFVSKRLSELEHELDLLPSVDVDAYRKAHSANPSYTTDRSFRLQFLRAERFNAKAAAERLARYFREKIQLFPELVGQKITLGDLADDDMATLTSGFFQCSPSRDRSGRAILLAIPALEKFKDLDSMARAVFYFLSAVLEDEETQKRGAVIIVWVGGFESDLATKRTPEINPSASWKMSVLLNALPIRIEGVHVGCDQKIPIMTVNLARAVCHRVLRLRSRYHHGTAVEVRYALMSFGIGTIAAITELGYFTLEPHDAWMDARRQLEAERGHVGPPTVSPENDFRKLPLFQMEQASAQRSQQQDQAPSLYLVGVPSPNDVLFGNRQLVHMHAGNTRYKALVESYRDEYELANKVEKTKIAKEIILRVKSGNGRFLKQATKGSDTDGSKRPAKRKNRCSNATIGWVEVTDVQAREKIAHAFRNLRARAPKAPSMVPSNTVGPALVVSQGAVFGNSNDMSSTWGRCDCIGGDSSLFPSSNFLYSEI